MSSEVKIEMQPIPAEAQPEPVKKGRCSRVCDWLFKDVVYQSSLTFASLGFFGFGGYEYWASRNVMCGMAMAAGGVTSCIACLRIRSLKPKKNLADLVDDIGEQVKIRDQQNSELLNQNRRLSQQAESLEEQTLLYQQTIDQQGEDLKETREKLGEISHQLQEKITNLQNKLKDYNELFEAVTRLVAKQEEGTRGVDDNLEELRELVQGLNDVQTTIVKKQEELENEAKERESLNEDYSKMLNGLKSHMKILTERFTRHEKIIRLLKKEIDRLFEARIEHEEASSRLAGLKKEYDMLLQQFMLLGNSI